MEGWGGGMWKEKRGEGVVEGRDGSHCSGVLRLRRWSGSHKSECLLELSRDLPSDCLPSVRTGHCVAEVFQTVAV